MEGAAFYSCYAFRNPYRGQCIAFAKRTVIYCFYAIRYLNVCQ